MIKIENLSKNYFSLKGPIKVLNNINIEVPSNLSVGLVGRNGAGKSTLLRLLAGAETPDKGKIIVPSKTSWAVGIASGIATGLTGRQNTKFIALLHGASPEETKEIENFVLDFSELGDFYDYPTSTYSAGMGSRLSFALAMAIDFDLLLLDEITAVGDESFRKRCHNMLLEKKKTKQIVIASHSRAELEKLVDCALFIKDGTVEYFNSSHDAFDSYRDWMLAKNKTV